MALFLSLCRMIRRVLTGFDAIKSQTQTQTSKLKKIYYLTFELGLGVNVTQNIAQKHLHHDYIPVHFEVATTIGLGGDVFSRKYIILLLRYCHRVKMIRKYHNHKLQTTPWHRMEQQSRDTRKTN